MKYVVVKRNYKEFIDRFITYRINDSNELNYITMKSLLESLELKFSDDELKKYGINLSTPLLENNKNKIVRFFWEKKGIIEKNYDKEKMYMVDLYRKCIGSAKNIALVDVGWSGHNLLGLKYFITNEINSHINVKCWMACERLGVNQKCLLDKEIDAYIFSSIKNKDIPNRFHNKYNSKINTPFFEIATQETIPSFLGYNENGEMQFDIPIVEDYQTNKEIEQGILDFCKIYFDFSNMDVYLRNIPGRDAYAPFAFAIKNVEFIKRNFSNVHNSFNIGSNNEQQKVESFKEQLFKK